MGETGNSEGRLKLVASILVQALWLLLGLWALDYGWSGKRMLWLVIGGVSLAGSVWSLAWIAKTGRPTWW